MTRRFLVLALVGFVFVVGWAVYALRIEDIRVTGLRTLSARQIVDASGLHGGERILWIRLSSVARRVEALPAVAGVVVERSLPHTVVIRVSERTAVARLTGKARTVVDADGSVFDTDATNLRVIAGWKGSGRPGTTLDAVSRIVLDAFVRFPATLRERTKRIDVGPPLTLRFADKTEVRFGRLADLDAKADAAAAVLAAERGRPLAYVDVRAPSVPVTRGPTPPPTPPPTPQPTADPAPAPETTPAPASTPAP